MQSRLSLVKELFIATLMASFTQRLCSFDSDAPLEKPVHIVGKSEQFSQCTMVKPDNVRMYTLATPCCNGMRRAVITHLPATILRWTR